VTADSLACLQGTSIGSASSRLAAAAKVDLLSRHDLLVGQPALYTLTLAGMRMSGLSELEPCRVSVANAPHAIACARAAAELQRRYPDLLVAGERELRRDERSAGRPLASAVLDRTAGDRARLHRPDLVLWPPAGAPIAIEVELTVKAPRRLSEICRAWARSREVAGVIYLAPAPVRRALLRALEQASAESKIAVLPLDSLPLLAGHTPAESPVPSVS
jgi:hypothetical protein